MTVKAPGALFKNQRRQNENAPEYRGDFKLTKELLDAFCHAFDKAKGGDCKIEIAAWVKESKATGTKYFSLSISPPFERNPQERPQSSRSPRAPQSDDIPF